MSQQQKLTTKTPLSKRSRTERPRYHLGWGETPPLCRHRRHRSSERARPDHGGLSRPTSLPGDGSWELGVGASHSQSPTPSSQLLGSRRQLGCGFGACLLVELTLSSTRWMSGAARTLHRRRCSVSIVGGTVPHAVSLCQCAERRIQGDVKVGSKRTPSAATVAQTTCRERARRPSACTMCDRSHPSAHTSTISITGCSHIDRCPGCTAS